METHRTVTRLIGSNDFSRKIPRLLGSNVSALATSLSFLLPSLLTSLTSVLTTSLFSNQFVCDAGDATSSSQYRRAHDFPEPGNCWNQRTPIPQALRLLALSPEVLRRGMPALATACLLSALVLEEVGLALHLKRISNDGDAFTAVFPPTSPHQLSMFGAPKVELDSTQDRDFVIQTAGHASSVRIEASTPYYRATSMPVIMVSARHYTLSHAHRNSITWRHS